MTAPQVDALREAAQRLNEARKALRSAKRVPMAGLDETQRQRRIIDWSLAEDEAIAASHALVALKVAAEPWLSCDDARLLVLEGRRCEL